MNWLDWLLALIVLLSAWRGLATGFIAGVARLLGLVLGLVAAFAGCKPLARYLDSQWNWVDNISSSILDRFPQLLLQGNPVGQSPGGENLPGQMAGDYLTLAARQLATSILEWLSFIALALAVYLLVIIVMRLLSGAVAHTFISPLDRLGGLALGLARGALVVVLVAALLNTLYSPGAVAGGENAGLLERAVAGSVILPYTQVFLDLFKLQFPDWPPGIKPAQFI